MNFNATKHHISAQHASPPDSFLIDLVTWAKGAPDHLFEPNDRNDIYTKIRPKLGNETRPFWTDLIHRKAAMMETARVHAGIEADWNFKEDVDQTNKSSLRDRVKRETGVFQVSFDSLYLDDEDESLHKCLEKFGVNGVESFITEMKINHLLVFEYYATLMRISTTWAGPVNRGEVQAALWTPAMLEFETLITT